MFFSHAQYLSWHQDKQVSFAKVLKHNGDELDFVRDFTEKI